VEVVGGDVEGMGEGRGMYIKKRREG